MKQTNKTKMLKNKGFKWQKDGLTNTVWANDCFFIDDEVVHIGENVKNIEYCRSLCSQFSRCTHFSWSKDTCYLKNLIRGNQKPTINEIKGAMCGYQILKHTIFSGTN